MSNKQESSRAVTDAIIIITFVVWAIVVLLKGDYGNKETEDAYKKLRDQGYTNKQIYEMGK
jgi:hypothetical protein